MNISQIKEIIPHRYPFLLVDKVIEMDAGRRAVGLKNVSENEWYFTGHFPNYSLMPGVLIIEALAQVGALALLSLPENKGKLVLFGGLDKVRFKREVRPGDVLRLEVEITRRRGEIGKGAGRAEVDGETAAAAEFIFALKESV